MKSVYKKWNLFLGLVAAAALLTQAPLHAGNVAQVKKEFNDYFKEFPWIGLIANKISYGPITISDVNIDDADKLAIVEPGETLHGSLRYKVHSKYLDSLHRYHLVIGIKGLGAQECVTHSYGIWDSKGKGRFSLKAPLEPGVYEVRFLFTEALTCDKAQEAWNSGADLPTSAATIGVIIVE